jgi:hypothetical protein
MFKHTHTHINTRSETVTKPPHSRTYTRRKTQNIFLSLASATSRLLLLLVKKETERSFFRTKKEEARERTTT